MLGYAATRRSIVGRPQVSFAKRQREQQRRERQEQKAARRAQRKNEKTTPESEIEPMPEEQPAEE